MPLRLIVRSPPPMSIVPVLRMRDPGAAFAIADVSCESVDTCISEPGDATRRGYNADPNVPVGGGGGGGGGGGTGAVERYAVTCSTICLPKEVTREGRTPPLLYVCSFDHSPGFEFRQFSASVFLPCEFFLTKNSVHSASSDSLVVGIISLLRQLYLEDIPPRQNLNYPTP